MAETKIATRRERACDQSNGKPNASGIMRGSPVQANAPTIAASATRQMGQTDLPGKGEHRNRPAKDAASGNRPEISGIIGSCKVGMEENLTGRHNTAGPVP